MAGALLRNININSKGGLMIKNSQDAWSPSIIETSLWLDADDYSSLQFNGSDVSAWLDKSNNTKIVEQTLASAQPFYDATGLNGKPAISFDGVSEWIGWTPALPLTAASIFFVGRMDTGIVPNEYFFNLNNSVNSARTVLQPYEISTSYRVFVSSDISLGSSKTMYLTNRIGSCLFEYGDQMQFGLDGDTPSTRSLGIGDNTWMTTDQRLARGRGGSAVYAPMTIAEFIICDYVVTTEIRQKIEGYLAHKWNMTGQLPNEHPYKNLIP